MLTVVGAGDVLAQLPPRAPRPIEVDAREAFVEAMGREADEWRLQPPTRANTDVIVRELDGRPGRRAVHVEEMEWRQSDGSALAVRYARFASSDDAALALAWERTIISVATFAVKGLADEAYYPSGARYSAGRRGHLLFRRGPFVFRVPIDEPRKQASTPPPGELAYTCKSAFTPCVFISDGQAVMSTGHPLARMTRLFLTAADTVLRNLIVP